MEIFKLFINGEWLANTDGKTIDVHKPADGELYAQIYAAGPTEVELAIASAVEAQKIWKKSICSEREKILLKAAEHLEKNIEKYAGWIIEESGSCFMKAWDEVSQSVDILRSNAGLCRNINGGVVPGDSPTQISTYVRTPLGVVAGIAPFNYPLLLTMCKVAPAIAAGNAFILKPSSATPLSGVIVAECLEAAGLPKGIFNIIPGFSAQIGDILTSDKRIKMLTFTGSTQVGRKLAEQCSKTLKRITLEMGGKNPLIVLKDFEIDQAVNIAVFGAYFHQGQICMGTSRIIVEEAIYDDFCEKLVERVKCFKPMDPHNPASVIGPLINDKQYQVLDRHIAEATAKGARLLCGGTHSDDGRFYNPSVLADVTTDMIVFHEESFGPLTSVIKAKDAADAVEIANDSEYGLSSAVLTHNMTLAFEMAQNIEAGMVHVNESTVCGSRQAPFGGVKGSGVGREGGMFSIEEFTELKWITYQTQPCIYPTNPGIVC